MNDTCKFTQLSQIRRALFFDRLITSQAQRIDEIPSLGEFKYFGISSDESWIFRPGKIIMTPCLGSSSPLNSPIADISPDFFELTAADVRAAQTSLSAKAMGYREAPLLTESLRVKRNQERIYR